MNDPNNSDISQAYSANPQLQRQYGSLQAFAHQQFINSGQNEGRSLGLPAAAPDSAPAPAAVAPAGVPQSTAAGYLNPAGGASTVDPNADFYKSPDYNFQLSQGLGGLTAKGAATNGTDNGATRKAEIDYAGNLASGQYQNYKNGLLTLAGLGGSSAGTSGYLGQANANAQSAGYSNIGSTLTSQGNATASSYLGQGAIAQKALTGLGSVAQQYLQPEALNPATIAPLNYTPLQSQPIASLGGGF